MAKENMKNDKKIQKTEKTEKTEKQSKAKESKAKEVKETKEPKEFEVIQPKFIDKLLNQFSIHVQDEQYLKPVPSLKQLPQTFAMLYLLRNATTTVDDKEQPLKPAEKFSQIISSIKNMKTCNNIKEFKLKNIQNSKLISQQISKQFEEEYQSFLQNYEININEPEKGKRRTVQMNALYKQTESEDIQEQKRLNIIHKQMLSLYNIFVAACEVKEEKPKKDKKGKKDKKDDKKQKEQKEVTENKEKIYELDQYTSEKELTKFIEGKFKQLLSEEVEKENKKGEKVQIKTPFQKNYERYSELLEKPLEEVQQYQLKQPFLKLYSQNKKEWNLDLKGYQVTIASTELLNKILNQWQDKMRTISQTKRFDVEQKLKQSQKSAYIKETDSSDEKKELNEQFNKQKQECINQTIMNLFSQEYPLEIIYNIDDKDVKQNEKSEKKQKNEKQKSKKSEKKQKQVKNEKTEEETDNEITESEDESENIDDAIAEIIEESEEKPEEKVEKTEKRRRHHSK